MVMSLVLQVFGSNSMLWCLIQRESEVITMYFKGAWICAPSFISVRSVVFEIIYKNQKSYLHGGPREEWRALVRGSSKSKENSSSGDQEYLQKCHGSYLVLDQNAGQMTN